MFEIKEASKVWENQENKDSFQKSCESVMRDIEKASKNGMRKTCFNPYDWYQYDSVKRAFKQKGYWFTPTGYVGGVWQTTENINW